ncbi:MAG: ComF family protein [Clostridia bacterium]|nr:ComF family protein [Clostridia bacterium]
MNRNIPFFNMIINILFPHNCIFCDRKLSFFGNEYCCDKCREKIFKTKENESKCLICGRKIGGYGNNKVCTNCAKNNIHFDASYPCFEYSEGVRNLIHKFKFRKQMFLNKYVSDYMIEAMDRAGVPEYDFLVYPPVNLSTFFERGYNQTRLVAVRIGKHYKKKVLKGAIVKTRQNPKQSLMTKGMRFINVKGVFKVKRKFRKLIKGKNILIVDDVMTTGATASEIAGELKKNGALSVYVAVFAVSGE